MIMADILFWLLFALGVGAVLIGHWLAAFALAPRTVERCARRIGERPVIATLAGIGVTVPLVVIAVATAKAVPALGGVIIGLMTVPLLLALVGSAGLALRIGQGLASPVDAATPWRRVLRGGVVLVLVFALPLGGWFVLLPWTLVSGLGALLLRRDPRTVAESSPRAISVAPVVATAVADARP